MITFFQQSSGNIFAVDASESFSNSNIEKLEWLFGGAKSLNIDAVSGYFIGPRKEMITPWSTNAVEITQNMGLKGIVRIEEFLVSDHEHPSHDSMLQRVYSGLDQRIFFITIP